MSKNSIIYILVVVVVALAALLFVQNRAKVINGELDKIDTTTSTPTGESSSPSTGGTTKPKTSTTTSKPAAAKPLYAADGSVYIYYSSTGFYPSTASVKTGKSAIFVNNSNGSLRVFSNPHPAHTLYGELNQSKTIGPDQRFVTGTLKVGSWGYHNETNLNHIGTIVVNP